MVVVTECLTPRTRTDQIHEQTMFSLPGQASAYACIRQILPHDDSHMALKEVKKHILTIREIKF